MNTAVLTTAYNEAGPIRAVIKRIPETYDLFVVDDGSTDETAIVSKEMGALIIRHCINLGQGYAFISGIKAIVNHHGNNYDYIAFIDADGQHDPAEIPKFIEKIERENLDVVVGSRILGSNYKGAPILRKMFLPVYSFIISKLTGYDLTDAMCGFRVFSISSLRDIIHIFDQMLEPQYLAAEMYIRFSRKSIKIGEVPIHMQNRLSGLSYKGTLRYGLGVLRAIIGTLFDRKHIAR